MAIVHRCDRCLSISDMGSITALNGEEELPPDWHYYEMPVRGSEGAKSRELSLICAICEDDLYHWRHPKARPER